MTTIADMQTLFATDPSEALYRAEEELSHADFLTFVKWANGTGAYCTLPSAEYVTESIASVFERLDIRPAAVQIDRRSATYDESDPWAHEPPSERLDTSADIPM